MKILFEWHEDLCVLFWPGLGTQVVFLGKVRIDASFCPHLWLGMHKKVKKKVETPKGMKAFPISAYWRVLQPKSEAVVEPSNRSFKLARAPTIAEEDADFVPVKYDFDFCFDRLVFTGTKRIPKRNRRGKLMQEKDGK